MDEGGWYDEYDSDDEGEEFDEWVEIFTDLMKGAMELTRAGHHAEAVMAYQMLLELLEEAGETTDILGNCSAPEDAIQLDFSKVVEAYTRSLLAGTSGRTVDDVITEILPVAKKYRYRGGFLGLARALDKTGRARLKERLAKAIEQKPKTDRWGSPDEVEGLIALAQVEKNHAEVLALKERFASQNAVYIEELLSHYLGDWENVARLAELGMQRFGPRGDYARALIQAREAIGDQSAAQEARIAHFLAEPSAASFLALRQRSKVLDNWDMVFEKLLEASMSRRQNSWESPRLGTYLLLAEGRENDVLKRIPDRRSMDFEEIKLVCR